MNMIKEEEGEEEEENKEKLHVEKASQSNSELPLSILMDILLKLPLPATRLCRCVSKSWCNIIEDPYFIKQFAAKPSTDFVLANTNSSTLAAAFDLASSSIKLYPFGFRFQPLASCNGLVLLADEKDQLINYCVCNPITDKNMIKLPRKPRNTSTYFCGFGFSPSTKEYKVVQLIVDNRVAGGEFPKVEIHTHGTDTWRSICEGIPNHWILSSRVGVYLNGALHWIDCIDELVDGHVLVIYCFDLKTERFIRNIPAPKIFGGWPYSRYDGITKICLGVLKGQLYISNINSNVVGETLLDIWVMKCYGVQKSWTKEFVIKLPSSLWSSIFQPRGIEVMNVMINRGNKGEEEVIATLCARDLLVVCNSDGKVIDFEWIMPRPVLYAPSLNLDYM